MSAWRRVAIEKIPRYRDLIEHADTIWMLWVELWPRFIRANSEPVDEELIGQIYDYAWWCANSPDPHTSTAGVLSFCEDLPLYPAVRAQMAKWLPAEVFAGMGQIFCCWRCWGGSEPCPTCGMRRTSPRHSQWPLLSVRSARPASFSAGTPLPVRCLSPMPHEAYHGMA